ncbi:putative membrane protein ArfC [Arthrobacter ulcerisalmonis]|uniref:Putative membrane protein ArfC n=1 Tax=Arthrobacter ulcerisalmonis TaxID=2483813 RepID=A0A3P5XNY8_9MICC|nr:hypothetical protein [Arthrobacter ulcerisalmonis]VDC29531.1 putative membrane protein ArfC [Arthrobacter ulcerisalmonis]
MDILIWIIVIVVVAGLVWWLLNRRKSSGASSAGTMPTRADGALSGGSAAASAVAAGTTGIATAAGFGKASEPAGPTTAEDPIATTASAAASGETAAASDADVQPSAEPAPAAEPQTVSAAATATDADAQPSAEPESASADGLTTNAPATPVETAETAETAESPIAADSVASGVTVPAALPADSAADSAIGSEPPAGPADVEPLPNSGAGQETEGTTASTPIVAPADTPETAETTPAGVVIPATEAPVAGGAGEWETQWSEPSHVTESAAPAHHSEYTDTHAATLPGAESAAGEEGDSAVESNSASIAPTESHGAETSAPASALAAPGHLAADEPYGSGSAAARADGSGPADFTVKGDATTMVYFEDDHADYESTVAGVWFESAAHAEAAGFRAPRRQRL